MFTVWSSRDHLQLADWLSKNEKAQFVEGLAARETVELSEIVYIRIGPGPKIATLTGRKTASSQNWTGSKIGDFDWEIHYDSAILSRVSSADLFLAARA